MCRRVFSQKSVRTGGDKGVSSVEAYPAVAVKARCTPVGWLMLATGRAAVSARMVKLPSLQP